VHFFQKEDILYQSGDKKHIKREGMETEKEKKAHYPKFEKKIQRERQKFYKVFCEWKA